MTNAFNLSQLANNTNSSGQVTLTTGVVGTLPVANGGTGVTTSTGTGANVLSTSPTLVTPLLGTPTSGDLTNCTGIPAPAALSTASGSAPSYSARAWVNFNGQGTPAVRASGNVSTITDNGVGLYTINFTTAMPDTSYSVSGTTKQLDGTVISNNGTVFMSFSYTTASVRCSTTTTGGAVVDTIFVNAAIFR